MNILIDVSFFNDRNPSKYSDYNRREFSQLYETKKILTIIIYIN